MSERLEELAARLKERFGETLRACDTDYGEVAIELAPDRLLSTCRALREEAEFGFEMLMDLAGVDYSAYGIAEWATDETTTTGFSRGVEKTTFGRFSFHDAPRIARNEGPRFAAAYQLLSISNNWRLRIRAFCGDDDLPVLPSVAGIWNCADWYEREAFDLYGIVFEGHPDLRRILTDYGFIGHPFRKDFPLIGNVEMRYDPEQRRVVYQPVSIEPRVLVPRVIRHDHRYLEDDPAQEQAGDA